MAAELEAALAAERTLVARLEEDLVSAERRLGVGAGDEINRYQGAGGEVATAAGALEFTCYHCYRHC